MLIVGIKHEYMIYDVGNFVKRVIKGSGLILKPHLFYWEWDVTLLTTYSKQFG